MNIIPFDFQDSTIQVILVDNEPWFLGKEIARVLGYVDENQAVRQHCDKDDTLSDIELTLKLKKLGQSNDDVVYRAIYINEPGVYSLVFGSTLKSAKKFKKWLTTEVIPSIRKTGSYSVNQQQLSPLEILVAQSQALLEAERDRQEIKARLDKLEAHQDSHDGYFTIRGYAFIKGLKIDLRDAQRLGKLAGHKCREEGLEISKVKDTRFGYVNAYPECILDVIF